MKTLKHLYKDNTFGGACAAKPFQLCLEYETCSLVVQGKKREEKEKNMTINSILSSAIWGQVNVLLMSLLFITMSSSGKGEHKTKGRQGITDSSRVL